MTTRLLDSLGTTGPLADLFDDRGVIAALLRFETALARAEAGLGVIPPPAAEAIAAAATPDAFDPGMMAAAARQSGTAAIAFVDRLRALVAARDPVSAGYVHWGATSQDATDTALVLLLAKARGILEADHRRLLGALRALSDRHAGTLMSGRTLLQPAAPVTFGLRAAGWHAASARGWTRLDEAFREALVLQFGGAAGTLAALGDRGLDVAQALGRELDLPVPEAPWHAHRDRLAGVVSACGIYVASLGKMASDVSLLMQAEVGEVSEPGGGSSSMPQKRNPAGSAVVLAAATRVPGLVASFLSGMLQQHERGLGGLQAELPVVAAVVQLTGSAVSAGADVAAGLEVDAGRMRANLDGARGSVCAERAVLLLTPALGRDAAQAIVAAAARGAAAGGPTLSGALGGDPAVRAALPSAVLASLDDPAAYLGAAERLRRRLLDAS